VLRHALREAGRAVAGDRPDDDAPSAGQGDTSNET
jgi:hypothetical protein